MHVDEEGLGGQGTTRFGRGSLRQGSTESGAGSDSIDELRRRQGASAARKRTRRE
jgi:hypothetical protein